MYDIIKLLNIEDENLIISNINVLGLEKHVDIERRIEPHFCPICNSKMYSKGILNRKIIHSIFLDGYKLIIHLKQRRWKCINTSCNYTTNDQFLFVDKNKRTSCLTDYLVLEAFRNINKPLSDIAKEFKISNFTANQIFVKHVNMKRLRLSEIVSFDEVYINMKEVSKYALVIQDFETGEPIDLIESRRAEFTEPYFLGIPFEERKLVKYIISDMYNPYIQYAKKYFPNAISIVDSFHVSQWILNKIDSYLRQLLKEFKKRDELNPRKNGKLSDEVYLLQHYRWLMLKNEWDIDYTKRPYLNRHFGFTIDTYKQRLCFLKWIKILAKLEI